MERFWSVLFFFLLCIYVSIVHSFIHGNLVLVLVQGMTFSPVPFQSDHQLVRPSLDHDDHSTQHPTKGLLQPHSLFHPNHVCILLLLFFTFTNELHFFIVFLQEMRLQYNHVYSVWTFWHSFPVGQNTTMVFNIDRFFGNLIQWSRYNADPLQVYLRPDCCCIHPTSL